jgi:hypothetical protein
LITLRFLYKRRDWRGIDGAPAMSVEQEVGGSSPPNCTTTIKSLVVSAAY